MIPLIDYIFESRGVVGGERSWTDLVNHICKLKIEPDYSHLSSPVDMEAYYIKVTDHLPDWMSVLNLYIVAEPYEWLVGGIAAFIPEYSRLLNKKLQATIFIAQTSYEKEGFNLSTVLEHELQHTFDYWMGATKNIPFLMPELSPKYKVGGVVGDPFKEQDSFVQIAMQDKYSINAVADLFLNYTYYTHQLELKAYCREMSKWLDKNRTKSWSKIEASGDDNGYLPLLWLDAFCTLEQTWEEILSPEDLDVLFWNSKDWVKTVFNRVFDGLGSKGKMQRILKMMREQGVKKVRSEYNRILKDHNFPEANKPNFLK